MLFVPLQREYPRVLPLLFYLLQINDAFEVDVDLLGVVLLFPPITINLDRKAGQPVRLSLRLVPKLQ